MDRIKLLARKEKWMETTTREESMIHVKICGDGVKAKANVKDPVENSTIFHIFSDDKEMTADDRKYAKILYKSQ
jgi:hypothetical protein